MTQIKRFWIKISPSEFMYPLKRGIGKYNSQDFINNYS